jgi:phage tail-like protein
MPEKRTSPYSAFNFLVQFDGQDAGGFSEVTGLGVEITMAEYRNGNDKENHVRKIPNINKVPDVTLKRGIISSKDWWEWIDDIRKEGWAAQKKSVTIVLRDEAGESEVGKWTLQNVAPVKYTGPSLNAKGGTDAAMEELVLSAEGIIYSES